MRVEMMGRLSRFMKILKIFWQALHRSEPSCTHEGKISSSPLFAWAVRGMPCAIGLGCT